MGLLGMLLLTGIIEKAAFRNNPRFGNEHASNWAYVDRQLGRKTQGREILCLGDSLVKLGILPSVLSERTGKSAYNAALFSGATPASYFVLCRALAQGARPKTIVLDCAAGILTQGPSSRQRAFPWAELLTIGEAIDLAWSAREPELLARIVLSQVLHSMKARFEIREAVQSAIDGKTWHREFELAINHRNWNQNDGAQAQMKMEFEDYPFPAGPRPVPDWKCHPVNQLYLSRLFAIAARHQIQVYWLLPPYSPANQAQIEFRGEDGLFNQFAERIQARFPNITVIDARHAGVPRSSFFDASHLDCEGAAAMTASIAEIMMHPQPGRRWIPLPAPRPTVARVEDTAESLAAVRMMNAQRARR